MLVTVPADPTSEPDFTFPRRQRLSGPAVFKAIYDRGHRETAHPLVAVTMGGNGLGFCRLGISVPRRVGNAVRRNRVKRLIREAFRHAKPLHPPGVDVVILVRPHEPMELVGYAERLRKLLEKVGARAAQGRLPVHLPATPRATRSRTPPGSQG
jgi:ribonuclease P protein component